MHITLFNAYRSWRVLPDTADLFSPGKTFCLYLKRLLRYPRDLNHHIRLCFTECTEGEVWILLSRHIVARDEPTVYIALHAFEEEGRSMGFVELENLTVKVDLAWYQLSFLTLSRRESTRRLPIV